MNHTSIEGNPRAIIAILENNQQPDGSVIGWPRVSAACTFEAPTRFEDVLDIRLFVERKGVKSLTIRYEFFRGETRVAHGRMKTACCLVRHDAPLVSIPIPPELDALIHEAQPPASQPTGPTSDDAR